MNDLQPPLNILMFGWELPPHHSGGLGTACHGIARGCLAIGGIALTLVLPMLRGDEEHGGATLLAPPGGGALGHGDADGQAILPCPYGGDLLQAAQSYGVRAAALARQHPGFDVIHAHDWLTAGAGIAAKQASGKPLVLHIHSTEYDRAGHHADPRITAIETAAMAEADLIIAVSNYTRHIVMERYGQPGHKVCTVYNGITPGTAPLPAPRTQAGKTVTFLGRVTQQKGPAYFIAAAAHALTLNPDLHFIMAGDGDLLPAMQQQAADLRIDHRVAFPGFLRGDEVRHLLDHSDIYVMPSVSEPFGIAALEAIEAGVPAILSRQSGVVELFEHVVKVDYWDVAAMGHQMARLAGDAGLRARLRQDARGELAGHDWSACATALQRSYRQLLASKPGVAGAI
ncbi:MAG TPA: glycosyltransferase family 4 protein [Telluria sp.]|nr:glycosyltransferase family 4 protein [Telluria sp.]